MIEGLYIDNYKCLVNLSLTFKERVLLIGPNGVGKTAILDTMYALRQLLIEGVKVTDASAFPASSLTRWQTRNTQTIRLQVRLADGLFEYHLEIEHGATGQRARIRVENLTLDGQPLYRCAEGAVQLYRDDHTEGPNFVVDWGESNLARVPSRRDNVRLTSFREYIRNVTVCGLLPAHFRPESLAEGLTLTRDGSNLADWFRHIVLERPKLANRLDQALAEVIDGFQEIRLQKAGIDARAFMVAFRESSKEYMLRFDELSDGQRALVALYGLLHLTEGQAYTLFLDEPDNFVALPEIQPWLMELSASTALQVVICSHHPELIDYLGANFGLLLSREESGVVNARAAPTDTNDGGLRLSELIARGWEDE